MGIFSYQLSYYNGARTVFIENTRLIRVSRKQVKRKMARQYSDILNSQESEGMNVNKIGLPIEMWSKMFGYLDFATQNCATLVCKLWLEMIRNEFKLSGELTMNSMDKMEATEINSIISKWKKLKILRALSLCTGIHRHIVGGKAVLCSLQLI